MAQSSLTCGTGAGSSYIANFSCDGVAGITGANLGNQVRQLDNVVKALANNPNPALYSEGKMRSIEHDGYKGDGVNRSYSMEGTENSIFAGGLYKFPSSNWSVGAFLGYTQLDMDLKERKGQVAGNNGTADHEAFFFGGIANWSQNATYLSIAVAGTPGSNKVNDTGTNFKASFDSNGFTAGVKVGHIFSLPFYGLKSDVQFGGTYATFKGDKFTVGADTFRSSAEAMQISFSSTTYKDIDMGGGTFLKPYYKSELKMLAAFDNKLEVNGNQDSFGQGSLSALSELGLGYYDGQNSYSAGMFADTGVDRFSWGGKLRVVFKLN